MGNNIFKETNELELIKIVKEEETQPEMVVEIAKHMLFQKHRKLIVKIARDLLREGIELEDLIQEGTRGFWIGVKKFNLDSGNKLATYAFLWIKNAIEQKLGYYGYAIKTPYSVKQDIKTLKKAINDFYNEHGYKPSYEVLANILGWKVKKVAKTIRYSKGVISMDEIVKNDSRRTTTFADMVKDEKDDPQSSLIKDEQKVELSELYKQILEPRDYKILAMQKGFNGQTKKSIKDIAKEFHLSIPRVKQILKRAITKLQNSSMLKEFNENYKN